MSHVFADHIDALHKDSGVSVAEVTRRDGTVAPAIWVGLEGDVEILVEALELAFYLVDCQRPYGHVIHLVNSIANLMRFYILKGQPPLDQRGLRPLIQDYVLQRKNGLPEFNWTPLSRDALQTELRHIVAFSDFCEREYGYLPFIGRRSIPLPSSSNDQKSFWRVMACNENDFFSHLAIRRSQSQSQIQIPGRRAKSSGAAGFGGMSEQFAWDLVEAERNTTYKAIWLLGFFGGPRLSETMNLWVCDVIPGSYREHLFPGDIFVDLPLVVIADPWQSRWCGKLEDDRTNREEFLLQKYGLRPRPQMAETESGIFRGKAAGFKGTKPTNKTGVMRQIFWAREEAGQLFERLSVEVFNTRRQMPFSRTHPFLFVNTDRRKPEIQGQMTSMSNVEKAFERAVTRIGGTPYRSKQTPHGMRHLYKDLIKDLLPNDAGAVQICMGHRSRESQNEYGSLDMQAMRHAMAFVPRRATS